MIGICTKNRRRMTAVVFRYYYTIPARELQELFQFSGFFGTCRAVAFVPARVWGARNAPPLVLNELRQRGKPDAESGFFGTVRRGTDWFRVNRLSPDECARQQRDRALSRPLLHPALRSVRASGGDAPALARTALRARYRSGRLSPGSLLGRVFVSASVGYHLTNARDSSATGR